MTNLNILAGYIQEVLGIQIQVHKVEVSKNLPYILQSNYNMYGINILDHDYNLMIPIAESEITPANINKHMITMKEKTGVETIYCCKVMNSSMRKRLIEYKVPFIVPGNQMYLPDLGIDLREYFKNRATALGRISPSTQVIILDALLNHDYASKTTSELTKKLHYSKMTIVRAFDELEANEIAKIEMRGKERVLQYELKGKELWDNVLKLLRNPIIKKVFVITLKFNDSIPVAGFTALSSETMISESQYRTYAMSREDYQNLKVQNNIKEQEYPSPDAIEIEIWSYSPCLLANGERVDDLSLFLSLKDKTDERVEGGLDSLLENVKW